LKRTFVVKFISREKILESLWNKIDSGEPIILAGCSIGCTAKSAEMGGADLILFYTAGRYTMAGRGSMTGLLPYGDSNALTLEMAREIVPVVKNTPVIAGVCGTDPFRDIKVFLRELKEANVSGVINFPTVAMFDGTFREIIEKQGISYELEVDMIRIAHELDMLTSPYVFNIDETVKMVKAGADMVIAHLGYKRTPLTLDESVKVLQKIHDTATKLNPNIILICHGEPIVEPVDFEYVYKRATGIAGFMGFSGVERLPTERAIKEQVKKFKCVRR
jgi:predicted TIM-barrel enzyme